MTDLRNIDYVPSVAFEVMDDIERIQKLIEVLGYTISKRQAYEIWSEHSNLVCAEWLYIYDDTEVIDAFDSWCVDRRIKR